MTQFYYGFRRHVRDFLGYILSPFRPSLLLRFPVREGSNSSSRSRRKTMLLQLAACSSSSSSSNGSSSSKSSLQLAAAAAAAAAAGAAERPCCSSSSSNSSSSSRRRSSAAATATVAAAAAYSRSRAAGRPCLTQFFSGFRRHVRDFLGCILSPLRPSLPLRFPVREGCICSISSTPCSISTLKQQQ